MNTIDTISSIFGILGGISGTLAFCSYLFNVFRHLQFKAEVRTDGTSASVTITNPRCVGVCIAEILLDLEGNGRDLKTPTFPGHEHFPKCIPPWAFVDAGIIEWTAYHIPANVSSRLVIVTTGGTKIFSKRGILLEEAKLAAARKLLDHAKTVKRTYKFGVFP